VRLRDGRLFRRGVLSREIRLRGMPVATVEEFEGKEDPAEEICGGLGDAVGIELDLQPDEFRPPDLDVGESMAWGIVESAGLGWGRLSQKREHHIYPDIEDDARESGLPDEVEFFHEGEAR